MSQDRDLFDKCLTLLSKIVCPLLGIQSHQSIEVEEKFEFSIITDEEELNAEKPSLEAYPPPSGSGHFHRPQDLGIPVKVEGESENIESKEQLVLMSESVDNNVGFKKYPY